ncbi:MAG: hypothetical protein AAF337_05930, partial [Pseudomonadota bacterium]
RGVHNLLVHYKAITQEPIAFEPWAGWAAPKHLEARDWETHPAAPFDGFFTPSVEVGTFVEAGDVLGHVIRLDDPLQPAHIVPAHQDGWLYIRASGGPVAKDENLVIIGQEVPFR